MAWVVIAGCCLSMPAVALSLDLEMDSESMREDFKRDNPKAYEVFQKGGNLREFLMSIENCSSQDCFSLSKDDFYFFAIVYCVLFYRNDNCSEAANYVFCKKTGDCSN